MKTKDLMQSTASDQAYQRIKQMIAEARLIPGLKIPIADLAEKLGVSQTPIIGALKVLEKEDFLVSLPNKGFFVKEVDMDELEELFEIREALELLAVQRSIINFDDQKMKEIEKALVDHREYHYDIVVRKRLALDAKFHLEIAEMGHNRNLLRLIKHVFERIYLIYRSEGISPTRLTEAAEQHEKLFNAINERDAVRAQELIQLHLRDAKTSMIRGIRRSEETIRF